MGGGRAIYSFKKTPYLADAKRYAGIIGATSWMQYESSDMGEQMSRHYERYPFTNIGHYSLYQVADAGTKGNSRVTIETESNASLHGAKRILTALAFRFSGARIIWSSLMLLRSCFMKK